METFKDNIPDCRRLTPERIRQEKGLENISDEQAEKLIRTMELISIMHTQLFLKEHKENSKNKKKKSK